MCCCDLLSLCQTSRDGEKLAAAAAAAGGGGGGGDADYGGIVIEQLVVRLRDDCRTRQRHHRRRCRRRVIVVGSVDHQQRHDSERRRRQRHDGTDDHRTTAQRIVLAVGRHRQMVHVRAAFHHLLRHGRQHFLDRHAPEPNVSVNYLTILPDVQVCSLAAAAYAPL